MDILETIVADKRREVAAAKAAVPESLLQDRLSRTTLPQVRSLSRALTASPHGIIAEFKRKSPSKGWIHRDVEPEQVVPAYASSGAAALSILTDGPYFGGGLDYIVRVRPLVGIPVLRKEFIIDRYQLWEARLAGADAVLLIAACLSKEECAELIDEAHRTGLEVLLEVHSIKELEYCLLGADVVGVNNRNLGTFCTDVKNSFSMAEALKTVLDLQGECPVMISESGISSPDTVRELRAAGFRGFLMGECFMKENDPGVALKNFIDAI